ncbi:MAG: hypothetical protein ACUVRZ_09695, partial [Desulfobacca sp.]|uniref:hypothetical protein n=1 Tax=Desulfobacca sp. TaxID=2067990 RepID=UPI004049578C
MSIWPINQSAAATRSDAPQREEKDERQLEREKKGFAVALASDSAAACENILWEKTLDVLKWLLVHLY